MRRIIKTSRIALAIPVVRMADQMRGKHLIIQNVDDDKHARFTLARVSPKATIFLTTLEASRVHLFSYAIHVGCDGHRVSDYRSTSLSVFARAIMDDALSCCVVRNVCRKSWRIAR